MKDNFKFFKNVVLSENAGLPPLRSRPFACVSQGFLTVVLDRRGGWIQLELLREDRERDRRRWGRPARRPEAALLLTSRTFRGITIADEQDRGGNYYRRDDRRDDRRTIGATGAEITSAAMNAETTVPETVRLFAGSGDLISS